MGSRPHRVGEPLLAAAIALGVCGSLIVEALDRQRATPLLLAVPVVAAVILRRRQPLVALVAALVAPVALAGDAATMLPALLVMYGIGLRQAWSSRALIAIAVPAAGALALLSLGTRASDHGTLHSVCGVVTLGAAAFAAGLCVTARRRVVDEQTARRSREHELLTSQALALERLRIARELHDAIGHNVSLMVVQAQALGATASDSDVATTTDAIADLGRVTMVEMHRTLKLLRDERGDAPLAPQPGLSDLAELVAQTRSAGVDVTLAIEGEPRPLSQTADLTAFRIVQEALTNVLKHASGAATTITIAYTRDGLRVSVVDGGAAAAVVPPASGGFGLAGMRERAALFGGTLRAAPRADQGFEVNATLPYGAPAL